MNPIATTTPNNTVNVVATGILGLSSSSTGGWRFDNVTGEFIGDE